MNHKKLFLAAFVIKAGWEQQVTAPWIYNEGRCFISFMCFIVSLIRHSMDESIQNWK
jgi:hypothetical protein